MTLRTRKTIIVLVLALYSADSIWKIAHWQAYSAELNRWTIAGALALRAFILGVLLTAFQRVRRRAAN